MLFPTLPLTPTLMAQHHAHRWRLRVISLQRLSQVSLLVSRSLPGCCRSPSSSPIPPGVRASAFKLMMLEIQNEYIHKSPPSLLLFPTGCPTETILAKTDRLEKAVERAEALK